MWGTEVDIQCSRWSLLDFGYFPPWGDSQPELIDDFGCELVEHNQRLLIHTAEGLVFPMGQVNSTSFFDIRHLDLQFRAQMYSQ